MGLEVVLSFVATIISLLSVYFAYDSAQQARNSVLASTILELHSVYNQEDMKAGIQYLFTLRDNNHEEFQKNSYNFAKAYVDRVDESSKEWYYRRVVLLFWSRIGVLLKTGLLTEDIVFTLFPNVEVLEILEAIEVVLAEKYNAQGDQYIALVFRRWKKWKRHKKISKEMRLPLNPSKYALSKKNNRV
jgi:hypothetical protein